MDARALLLTSRLRQHIETAPTALTLALIPLGMVGAAATHFIAGEWQRVLPLTLAWGAAWAHLISVHSTDVGTSRWQHTPDLRVLARGQPIPDNPSLEVAGTEPPTVLVVEDCPVEVFLTETFLKDLGVAHRCVVVPSGHEALSWLQAQSEPPALIVLDLNMPAMNGFEFLEAYTERYPRLRQAPVLVATSSARADDKRRCLKHECVCGFVTKPLVLQGPDFMARVAARLLRDEAAV